jgi:hypothetical protein
MIGILHPLIAELSTITAFVGNGIVLAALVGMVAFSWRQGLFVATVVALGCLAALIGALAGAASVSRYLLDLEVPESLAPVTAYSLGLCGLLLALRGACGRWLPEQAAWMGGLASRLAACWVGGVAGAILAAAALIGWTMLPLPASLALRPGELFWDPGPWALKVFARCAEFDRGRRDAMLGTTDSRGGGGGGGLAHSEPFFDENRNCVRDPDERFLDGNGDGQFTMLREAAGTTAGQPAWRPGLLDHYRLAAWRQVMAFHAPRISSEDVVSMDVASLTDGIYRATVVDPDICDATTFALEADAVEGGDPRLTIDPQAGVVTLTESEIAAPRRKYTFTVTATDKAGLSDARQVTVTIQGLPDPPAKP